MPGPFDTNKGELMRRVLDRLGVRFSRTKTGWQKVSCPGEGHAHGDRNPSASVNTSIGKFQCFACDLHGDGYDLILACRGIKAVDLDMDLRPDEAPGQDEWIL